MTPLLIRTTWRQKQRASTWHLACCAELIAAAAAAATRCTLIAPRSMLTEITRRAGSCQSQLPSRLEAMATSDASYSNFRQLGVRRRHLGLLHIEFQQRWNIRTIYELMRVMDMTNADPTVQVVVLSGDLSVGPHDPLLLEQGKVKRHRQLPITRETQTVSRDDAEDRYIHEKSANFVMRSLAKKMLVQRKLLVALVEGRCTGLGLSLCSLCDLVYAMEAAVFLPAFSHLDPCAQVGPFWTLPHIRWLLHLGEQADAKTALHCGLVASVVSESQEFWDRMDQYSRLPSPALMATKRLLLHQWRQSLLTELRQEGTPMAAQGRRLARSKL